MSRSTGQWGRATWVGVLWSATLVPGPLAAQASDAGPDARGIGTAALTWAQCRADQIQVMIVGTFHFSQTDEVDVLQPGRQAELDTILRRLETFAPQMVAVEYPYERQQTLQDRYDQYLRLAEDSLPSENEVYQLGFRLARRLGLATVAAVDVPMNLWHDSIQVFDETFPRSRSDLRRRWRVDRESSTMDAEASLSQILVAENRDDPPANGEMYANFLPLVEDGIYAGALKLRPWYDRNLRIVQNLFRLGDPEFERIVLVIGSGHLRVLKQIMEMTPQLCPVNAIPYLSPV